MQISSLYKELITIFFFNDMLTKLVKLNWRLNLDFSSLMLVNWRLKNKKIKKLISC